MTVAEAIVATVREPLLLLDDSLRVRMASRAFYRTFCVPAEETVGSPFLALGNGQWRIPALRELLDHVVRDDRAFDDFEVEHTFEHIGRRTMLLNARRLVRATSEPVMVLLAIEDVTERVRIEREKARLTEELRRSNDALAQFASVAAHDLQEPLRKIQAFGERLQAQCGAGLDERGRDYLTRMLAASARMRALIQGLLDYARISSGRRSPARIALQDVVAGVTADLELDIERSGADIAVEPLPVVPADALQIRQVFQNLLGNALKFRRVGVPPRIRIYADEGAADGEYVCVVVEDNGIGFEPEHAEDIFGLFRRLHGRDAYDGSGIGLALCRRIVERHGGHLTAESQPGSGARFIIALPRQSPPSEVST